MSGENESWRLPVRRVNNERVSVVYRAVLAFARAVVPLVSVRHWRNQETIPKGGGVLVVSNHLSNFDALALGEYLIYSGRWPRFLGKSDIFRIPVLGWIARKCRQIPVYRNTDRARDALIAAEQALEAGDLVAMFPEGTITADPDGWPMTARLGAAHLALTTGVPLIPVAQSGTNLVLGQKKLEFRRLFGKRKDVYIEAGDPIDLSPWAGRTDKEAQLEVTEVILDTLTAMVSEIRGFPAPEGRYDARVGARVTRP
ncbi:lysophospholipid acyltransferase family protein [Tessaracoccus caeni]|uniref:lysophospholipid acyltransferase family protein n=1 Tax=Tessaracoccus caeni TaxID=3031239 RepID=UPI0023DC2CD5|nr:lysophospholipid acyltransferase family protein [Tessaracoccus caeni]MDF1487957.1 lysophospholipid acyltransferase family protein [Tessaracoccus caeni]